MSIRDAEMRDLERVAELATELGYPTTAVQMEPRLARMLASVRDRVLVAEMDGHVAGWIHIKLEDALESDTYGEIRGLIVGDGFRSRGIGLELMRAGEAWLRELGIARLRVRSNVIRVDAHRFYEREGFRKVKQSFVLEKLLSS
jgi:N-acetylglutamate synthase-like GNAT family acetyltransferase